MNHKPFVLLLVLILTTLILPVVAEPETPQHVLKSAVATRGQYSQILDQVLKRQEREVAFYRQKFILTIPDMAVRLRNFIREAGTEVNLDEAITRQTGVYRQVLQARGNSYRENFRELARQYQELLGRHVDTAPEVDSNQLLQKLTDPSGDTLTSRLTDALESPAVWGELIKELDQVLNRELHGSESR